jgi:hypothetical protein
MRSLFIYSSTYNFDHEIVKKNKEMMLVFNFQKLFIL